MEQLEEEKIDLGIGTSAFDGDYLGRTTGDTTFAYSFTTQDHETEEDGVYDESVTSDQLLITVPTLYTDVDTLAKVMPWATLVTGTDGSKKLVVGKVVGMRLAQYAKQLVIHPEAMGDSNKSKDLTVFKCYPKPGEISFAFSRTGQRVANIVFRAIRDSSKPVGMDFYCIGDPSISADVTAPTVSGTTPADNATAIAKASGLNIDFTMSKAINQATAIKSNVTLVDTSTGEAVTAFNVSYISDGNKIRLTTTAALSATTEYLAILGTGITDLAGNHLAAPNVLSFTTGS